METPGRYCDLVMKGGITSGLVYPQAVLELAGTYRLKSIGGTSAGAIAAAVTAAAALGDRRIAADPALAGTGTIGMAGLRSVAGDLTRQGFIRGLFQPAPSAGAAYRLLVRLAARPGWERALDEIALALLRMAWFAILLSLAVLLGLAYWIAGWNGVLAAALPALLCASAIGLGRALRATAKAARDNFFGLCTGLSQGKRGGPALTEWMHEAIRALAGLDGDDGRPVTFADLWNAPLYEGEPESERVLSLQIITTNLSHSEPRTLPFTAGGLYFRKDEFERLFPEAVTTWLEANAPSTPSFAGTTYFELPTDGQLPIVVAARMSLSFPLLISAVPLHERDFGAGTPRPGPTEPAAAKGERPRPADAAENLAAGADSAEGAAAEAAAPNVPMRRCWFSDGGVSSNFPIHLFDSPLPRWPTFAIDLINGSRPDWPNSVFLPTNNNQGLRPGFRAIGGRGALTDVAGFLTAIVETMQNWRDLLQGRAPGHRDRIVRIALDESEGGMNLDMPAETLAAVAAKGRLAGAAIVEGFSFDNHFWVRYRNAVSAIERFTIGFGQGLKPPLTADNRAAHDRMWSRLTPTAGPYRFSREQAEEAVTRLTAIRDEAELWADSAVDLTEGAPKPLPHLRIVPIF